jgi:3-polyprenyl-4-hydroxybenzoate decarboxylase
VVDDDIDIHDYAAVDWAIAFRVNAGEDDIVIMPSTFGAGLDPSVRKRDRNVAQFGTGKWNRVLIDATINLDYDPDPDLGGARFPPTVRPAQADIDAVKARWRELGLDGKSAWRRQRVCTQHGYRGIRNLKSQPSSAPSICSANNLA